MSSSDPDRRLQLTAHADSLYAMAHVLTLNAADAAAAVEAVYRRAAEEELPPPGEEKAWLLRLLRAELRSTEAKEALPTIPSSSSASGDFRRKLALRAVQRVMPAAFASLDVSAREVLMLIHVERYDRQHAAAVMGEDEEQIQSRLIIAEQDLRTRIFRSLSASEVSFLQQVPENWLRDAVNDMVANDLPPMPPTVRTDLVAEREVLAPVPLSPRRAPRVRRPQHRLRRAGIALLIIFFAGFFAYGAARILERPLETNALVLSADAASNVRLDLVGDSAEEAAAFVQQQLDWRLTVPEIEGATLMGVQIREIGAGIRVPALYFEDSESDGHIAVIAFTYALLDRAGDRLQFEPATLTQIQDPGHYELHDLGRQQLLVWRHRNNIFVAVTRGQAEALQDRVYPST